MANVDSIDQREQAAAERATRLGYAISKRLVFDPLPYSLRTDSRLTLDQLKELLDVLETARASAATSQERLQRLLEALYGIETLAQALGLNPAHGFDRTALAGPHRARGTPRGSPDRHRGAPGRAIMNAFPHLKIKRGKRYRDATATEILGAAAALLVDETRGEYLRSPSDALRLCRALCAGREHELFGVVWLDTRHRVLHAEVLFSGTIDGAAIYPRVVAKRALELNVAAAIFAHNHPSGIAEPSTADRAITIKLRDALALLDVRVLDHLVVTNGESISLAERGWL